MNDRYENMTDEEVIALSREGDDQALDHMLKRYMNFVRIKARGYFLMGADREDIIQEGMLGLFKAIRDYKPDKQTAFRIFADLCITRQIITAIKSATRQKHIPLNYYISLNRPIFDDEPDRTLMDMLSDMTSVTSPEDLMIDLEDVNAMRAKIRSMLTTFERQVLSGYLEGKSYQEISEETGRNTKPIDNALQRIRKKLAKMLEEGNIHDA